MAISSLRAALSAATLALVLGGCADEGAPADGSATATGAGSPSSAGPDSGTTSGSAESTPSPSPTPTVEPATGQLIETEWVSLRGMPEWTSYYDDLGIVRLSSTESSGRDAVSISHWGGMVRASLRERARMELEDQARGRILPPVEFAGSRWFHVSYRDAGSLTHAFGTRRRDLVVTIHISQLPTRPEAEQQRIIDAILATFAWKR